MGNQRGRISPQLETSYLSSPISPIHHLEEVQRLPRPRLSLAFHIAKFRIAIIGVTVSAYLNSIDDPEQRKESKLLCKWMKEKTGAKAVLWDKIIGFGKYQYRYASGREGEWFRIGFAPRARGMSIYLMADFEGEAELMKKVGKHKMGKCCMTFRRLSDLNETVLKELIHRSFKGAICSAA